LIAMSTGAAADVSPAGRSQATLTLMFSPGADAEAVASYWRKRFGIRSDAETVPLAHPWPCSSARSRQLLATA
jgi:hypothetical protein